MGLRGFLFTFSDFILQIMQKFKKFCESLLHTTARTVSFRDDIAYFE